MIELYNTKNKMAFFNFFNIANNVCYIVYYVYFAHRGSDPDYAYLPRDLSGREGKVFDLQF